MQELMFMLLQAKLDSYQLTLLPTVVYFAQAYVSCCLKRLLFCAGSQDATDLLMKRMLLSQEKGDNFITNTIV